MENITRSQTFNKKSFKRTEDGSPLQKDNFEKFKDESSSSGTETFSEEKMAIEDIKEKNNHLNKLISSPAYGYMSRFQSKDSKLPPGIRPLMTSRMFIKGAMKTLKSNDIMNSR